VPRGKRVLRAALKVEALQPAMIERVIADTTAREEEYG
jgi:hypothetical protein